MSDITISFLILGVVVVLFVWNRLPVEVVAVGAALSLYATGVLTINQVVAGFGDPTVLFIASLFVVSEGLDAAGVTGWAGQQLMARVGSSRTRLLLLTLGLVALLTALISVNGAVAALLPVAVITAIRMKQPTSQLLLPLAFTAHAGSLLALTGTPVNVLVSEAAQDAGVGSFGYFEFALVGVPLVVGTIAIIVLFGRRLLPHRRPKVIPADLSDYCRTLVREYDLDEGSVRLRVEPDSPIVGQRRDGLGVPGHPEVSVLGVQPGGVGHLPHGELVAPGDLVVVRGDADAVGRLAASQRLTAEPGPAEGAEPRQPVSRELGAAEVVVPPRSGLIGTTVFPGMVTDSGDLLILAVKRGGDDLGSRESKLAAGDVLLLQGSWGALDENLEDPDVVVVHAPDVVRRQAAPLGFRAKAAVAVLVAMVVLLASGTVPAVVAGLLAAGAMVVLRVLTMEQAYRGISWTTVVLVGGMIPLSTAMQQTGAAEKLANGLVDIVGDGGPYALALGLFLLTAALGQLISNTATALIVIPIAISAAAETGTAVRPLLMTVAVAAAAAFITPVATPVNLMVMEPGGYRFGDYWKLGLPLMLLYLVIGVFLVPVFWSY